MDTPAHAPPEEPTTYTSLQAIETAIGSVSSLVEAADTDDTRTLTCSVRVASDI